MDWILEEVLDDIKARTKALKKIINDEDVDATYKLAKTEELKWLLYELHQISLMMIEEADRFEESEEDLRTLRADATMGI